MGDAQTASERVADIADVEIRIVEAGHLMAGEVPDEINGIILDKISRLENPDSPGR